MRSPSVLSRSLLCLCALAAPALAQRIAPALPPPAGPLPVPAPPDDITMPAPYLPRTLAIRNEPGQGSAAQDGWISTRGHSFHRIPKLAASVVVEEDDTNLAITFSAESFVTGPAGTRLFTRALVDRVVAAPADVVFTQDVFLGARSFTFTAVVDAGIHTVEMEWLVDDLGSLCAGYLRAASLELRTGKDDDSQSGTLTFKTAPSGPQESTRSDAWNAIPDMELPFYVPEKCSAVVTFSAEAAVSDDGEAFFLRATVDGDPMRPADVVFTRTERAHCRTMIFGESALAPGWHDLDIEWAVADPSETAHIGDRTVVVSCYPKNFAFGQYFVSPPSGPLVQNDDDAFVSLPGMQQMVKIPANGELSAKVAGEFYGLGTVDVLLQLEVGGIVFAQDTVFFRGGNELGAKSFAFDAKHMFPGLPAGGSRLVKLRWAAEGTGIAFAGDRAMTIVVEPGDVPDLAEPAPFGGPDPLIEPAVGTRKVLTIFWDPHRVGHPAFDKATLVDSLFGPEDSVADYFSVVSSGRFTLENAGTLGYYDAWMPADHYWGDHPECGEAGNDGFESGHQEKWYEALQLADPDFDYAVHDRDGDGVVRYDELAVLMVIPQVDNVFGTAQVGLSPFCDDQPVVFDGVEIEGLVEWYVADPYEGHAYSTAAHELAHLILRLPDMYVSTNPDGQYANFDTHTEPGGFSLMADNGFNTTHLDPMHKMALGWAAPTWVDESGWYELEDVRWSGQLLVLPREDGGDGREYLVVENRQPSSSDDLYDDNVSGRGLVLWHVIPHSEAQTNPPPCMPANEWNDKANNSARRGVRLLRPGIAFALTTDSVWNLEEAYDIDGFGLVCPDEGSPHNALLWSDGTPSGYRIGDFSPEGSALQTFFVHVGGLP